MDFFTLFGDWPSPNPPNLEGQELRSVWSLPFDPTGIVRRVLKALEHPHRGKVTARGSVNKAYHLSFFYQKLCLTRKRNSVCDFLF